MRQGEQVATLESVPLCAPFDGLLRGLTHDGVWVQVKTKVIEVDPRGVDAMVSGIAERPARIAMGVLQVVRRHLESSTSSVCL